jgi:hypothetical protein
MAASVAARLSASREFFTNIAALAKVWTSLARTTGCASKWY